MCGLLECLYVMPDQNGPKNAQKIILSPKCLLPPCRGQRDLRLGPQRSRPARGAKRPGGRLAQAPQNGRADCELGAAAHAAHCRAHLWAEPGPKFNTLLQGGHSGRGQAFVDIEIRVALYYKEFILWRTF